MRSASRNKKVSKDSICQASSPSKLNKAKSVEYKMGFVRSRITIREIF